MSPHPRSLRPLNARCQALSAQLLSAPESQLLAPLQPLPNLGVRIHVAPDIRATLDLSRKIYAVRDAYSDLVSKLHVDTPLLSSLAGLCATILGAQFHSDDSPDDALFDAIPSAYRPRALLMHALHFIIDSCPPCPSLYLALLDLTLERRLYHESEVLLDLTFEYAFESPAPRIANPLHRRFLVDLYSKWHAQFPSSIYVRLVTSALHRASSGPAWNSKATRLLARKISRYEPALLPDFVEMMMDTILSPRLKFKGKQKGTDNLENQLCEWFDLCIESCFSSIRILSACLLTFDHVSLVEDLLDICRSRVPIAGYDSLASTFLDAIICLYTLWLAYELRKISKHDPLHQLLRRSFPSSSTFTLVSFQLLRLKSLDEYENILSIFSSTLLHNGFPRIQSSLWHCALYCVEEPETEHSLIEKHGQEAFKQLRSRLISHVEEVENRCFTGNLHAGSKRPLGAEISYGDEDIAQDFSDEKNLNVVAGCCAQRNDFTVGRLGGPSKRRKLENSPDPHLSQSHCHRDRCCDEKPRIFKRGHPKGDTRYMRYRAKEPYSAATDGDHDSSVKARPENSDDNDDSDETRDDDDLNIFEDLEVHQSSEDPLDLFKFNDTSSYDTISPIAASKRKQSRSSSLLKTASNMPLPNKDGKPFVLSDTLRDLALLRASDLDLATLVPTTITKDNAQTKEDEAVEESLKSSYDYVRSARNIVKTNDRGDVDVQGQRIERVREELSNVDEGLIDV